MKTMGHDARVGSMQRVLMTIAIFLVSIPCAFAETRTISWDPVTRYTDNTLIEAGKTVNYSAYWTTDPGLGSLRTIGASLTTTSTTFDPGVQGMTRGGTVYFTAKDALNTGEESALSPAFAWVVPMVDPPPVDPPPVDPPPVDPTVVTPPVVTPPVVTLTGIAVSGPSSVNEGSTGTYTATGTWDNGTTAAIRPMWSVSPSYASIGSGGLLTASTVTVNQAVTVTAGYGGKTATMGATIVDVPVSTPAAPGNFTITGPTSSVPTVLYQLGWNPVTTNRDGTSIDLARIVRYTAYWTDDPALSVGSLRPLDSLISGTTQDFDPSANGMTKNQVVYLSVRAILDTGEQSSLAAGITWRVANVGPVPPAKGRIVKK